MNRNIDASFRKLMNNIKNDVFIEFDRNFERKAFFNTAWKSAKRNTIGSLLNRTSALRKSMRAEISGNNINFTSSEPYANIHNSGGQITITAKMRKFFWYKYKIATGSMQTTNKGRLRNNARNRTLSSDAEFWKAMALKPVGSVIVIPKRQFIGDHPQVRSIVKERVDDWVHNDIGGFLRDNLNNMIR